MDANEKGPPSLVRNLLDRNLEQGSEVWYDGTKVVVQTIISAEQVQIRLQDGSFTIVGVNLLSYEAPAAVATLVGMSGEETSAPSAERLAEAQKRNDCIRDLIFKPEGRKKKLVDISKSSGYAVSTLYEWIKFYEQNNIPSTDITFLLPPIPHGGRGGFRLGNETKRHIDAGIALYLNPLRPSVEKIVKHVDQACKIHNEKVSERNKQRLATEVDPELEKEIKVPSYGTTRYQIKLHLDRLGPAEVARLRGEVYESKQYEVDKSSTPGADSPLELMELDHKIFKVMLVDEVTGKYTQRPYLTASIDVCSRMLGGYCISLDPTGAFTTGVCMANTLLPKDEWLRERQLDPFFKDMKLEWPLWGAPAKLEVDNAKELRSPKLAEVCHLRGLNVEWSPVRTPHYKGHIESFMKTVDEAMRGLPGALHDVKNKQGRTTQEWLYSFTMSEFETWFARFVIEYHNRLHQNIGTSPLAKFHQGVSAPTVGRPRTGIPPPLAYQERLRIDFLPQVTVTIQRYGIQFEKTRYADPVLRPFRKKIPGSRKAVEYTMRIDPGKMNSIQFFDPNLERYWKIPRRTPSAYPLPGNREPTLWEIRAANDRLRVEGIRGINEKLRDRAIRAQHQSEIDSAVTSAKARKNLARKSKSHKAKIYQEAEDKEVAVKVSKPPKSGTKATPKGKSNVIPFPKANSARPFPKPILGWHL
jgi:putative transposase